MDMIAVTVVNFHLKSGFTVITADKRDDMPVMRPE